MKPNLVTVEGFYTAHVGPLQMKLIAGATGLKRVIREPTVNRPGLVLAGFTKYFANKRVQVIGNAEHSYLKNLTLEERAARYRDFFQRTIPCVVFSRGIKPEKQFLAMAEEFRVPIFQTPFITMKFINLATLALEMMFAARGSEMGSMVDILGIGVIIKGESGIGKSECVLGLIERGYSLVADDITKVTLVDGREILGSSSELTRDHMEVRGIGIINVASMFGIRSIRFNKRVNLVVTLKDWDKMGDIDRLGIEEEKVKILGVDIPHISIPVRPGRDLARLVEVAALHTKLKQSGYNPAAELNRRLTQQMSGGLM